jgi:benzil reductase ((S)-benzoin forming)
MAPGLGHNVGMNLPVPPHLFILTGASRGMGLAMARQLLAPGRILLCISRRTNDELAALAQARGAHLEQWSQDLADSLEAAERLERWLGSLHAAELDSATLINNAGVIPTISPLGGIATNDLSNALRVGLESPLALTSAFLRVTGRWVQHGWSGPRKVLNISSGLGRRAMASQAAYCTAKAGMDMYSQCVALEEAQQPNGARVVSLAPGVIDTDMQVQLRAGDPAAFPDLGNFIGMKERGQLTSPDAAAARVLAYLERPDFGSKVVADVRDPA